MERILRVLMAAGAAAVVVLALLIAGAVFITQSRQVSSHGGTIASSGTRYTATPTTPEARARPAPSPMSTAQPESPVVSRCRNTGNCAGFILAAINAARARHNSPALVLDRVQTLGQRGCSGTRAHSMAMAQSGRTWHINRGAVTALIPRSICGSGDFSEVIAQAGGSRWEAANGMVQHILRRPRAQRALLSNRFTRAGIAIARGHARYFLTVDLLR